MNGLNPRMQPKNILTKRVAAEETGVKPATRLFFGVRFVCDRPGRWTSECGKYGAYCMLAGTQLEQWEVYESNTGDPLDGDMIGHGLTFKEAMRDELAEMQTRNTVRQTGDGVS